MATDSSHKPSFTDSISKPQCGHVPSFIQVNKHLLKASYVQNTLGMLELQSQRDEL